MSISPDSTDDYLADGLTEELISAISSLAGITLIARTSVMRFKGMTKGIEEIARDLNVGTILEGSVRKAGNKLRIRVQLIDARTQGHLWSHNYDKELDDVFAVQIDIARQVADALRVRMLANETQHIEKRRSTSTEAYMLYLKGRYHWNERDEKGLLKAIEYFERAIEHDSEYALAYSGIADCYIVLGNHRHIPYAEAFSEAKRNASKAITIDASLAEPRASLASAMMEEYEWAASEMEFKKALELNPNYATAHHWYGVLLFQMARFEESLQETLLAESLDPLSLQIPAFCSLVYLAMGNYELARMQIRKIFAFDPEFLPGHHNLAWIFLNEGNYESAEREYRECIRLTNNSPYERAFLAAVYGFAGRKKEAKTALEEVTSAAGGLYLPNYPIILTYLGMGEKEKAIEMIESATQTGAAPHF